MDGCGGRGMLLAMLGVLGQVEVDHICKFWWQITKCQRDARRRGRSCCEGCLPRDTAEHMAFYRGVIEAFNERPPA